MKKWLPALLTCLIFIPAQGLRAQIVAGPITNATTGHYYYLVGSAYWTNAQAQARNLGGHLAAINDAAENAWILETFGSYGGVSRTLMIGFTDENQEGQWGWSNGDPPTYVNWAPGEPNNGQGIFSYENVAIMYGAGDPRAGLWNDMIGTLEEQQYWGVVEVTPLPELTIRVSEVELSWFALSGIYYQPQYRLSLTTNLWLDLGSPVLGTGSVSYLRDQVPIGAPQRFYRVRATPEPCPDSSGATRPSRGRVAKCCQHSDTRRRRSWSCWLSTPFHKCDHVCCVDFRFWRGATREHPPRWGTKIDFAALDLIRQETTIRVYASAAKNAVSLTGSRQSPVRTPLHRSNPNGSPS